MRHHRHHPQQRTAEDRHAQGPDGFVFADVLADDDAGAEAHPSAKAAAKAA